MIDLNALTAAVLSIPIWSTLLFLFIGTMIGLAVGVLPGISTTLGLALCLPIAISMPFHEGIALLVGCYKGGSFGGALTAIVFAIPGEAAASALIRDGQALVRQGKGGTALKTALYAAVIGDTASDIALIAAAIPLGLLAPALGPAEMTALFFLTLTLLITFSGGDVPRAIFAACLGFFLGAIGRDVQTGLLRLDFGIEGLSSGVSLIAVLLGFFTFPEIVENILRLWRARRSSQMGSNLRGIVQNEPLKPKEFFGCWRGLLIGTGIGTFVGAVPGPGSTVAAFSAYGISRQASNRPELYGNGSLEGIAAAESANAAVCGANLIPLITFGIPGSLIAGIFGAALILMGVTPGPRVIAEHPMEIYMLFLIFLVGNAVNLVCSRTTMPMFIRLANTPNRVLWPLIVIMFVLGVYSFDARVFDIYVALAAGFIGLIFRHLDIPVGPLVLAFLIGPLFEESLVRGYLLSRGDLFYFARSTTSMALWAASFFCIYMFIRGHRRVKRRVSQINGDGGSS